MIDVVISIENRFHIDLRAIDGLPDQEKKASSDVFDISLYEVSLPFA